MHLTEYHVFHLTTLNSMLTFVQMRRERKIYVSNFYLSMYKIDSKICFWGGEVDGRQGKEEYFPLYTFVLLEF